MKNLDWGQPQGPQDWDYVYRALTEIHEASFRVDTADDAITALEDRITALETYALIAAGATLTLTAIAHANRTILLNALAGSVVTLPAATGSGARYRFLVSVVATSNSHIVKVANASHIIQGAIALADQDTVGTVTAFVTAADSDTITLNRTTTGSVTRGEWIEITDLATNLFAVQGLLTNTAAGATPFTATV